MALLPVRYELKDKCPDREKLHTPQPEGYLQWHEWAERKEKTHRQEQCPTCGFWSVWVLKRSPASAT